MSFICGKTRSAGNRSKSSKTGVELVTKNPIDANQDRDLLSMGPKEQQELRDTLVKQIEESKRSIDRQLQSALRSLLDSKFEITRAKDILKRKIREGESRQLLKQYGQNVLMATKGRDKFLKAKVGSGDSR